MNFALLQAIRSVGKHGMTQKAVAARTCIDQSTLTKIIRGHRRPTQREREKLSRLLQQPESALFPDYEASR